MKILKRGTRPQDKIYEIKCATCLSELEAARHEGTLTSPSRPGERTMVTFECPVCKGRIVVDEASSKDDMNNHGSTATWYDR